MGVSKNQLIYVCRLHSLVIRDYVCPLTAIVRVCVHLCYTELHINCKPMPGVLKILHPLLYDALLTIENE